MYYETTSPDDASLANANLKGREHPTRNASEVVSAENAPHSSDQNLGVVVRSSLLSFVFPFIELRAGRKAVPVRDPDWLRLTASPEPQAKGNIILGR